MKATRTRSAAIKQLTACFERNGHLRWVDAERRRRDRGGKMYKKGYEVRLIAQTSDELETLQRSLMKLDFTPGRPYEQAKRFRLPLYGREAVLRFLDMIGHDAPAAPSRLRRSKRG